MKTLELTDLDYSGRVIEGVEVFYVRYYTTEEIKRKMPFWQSFFVSQFDLCEITNKININLYYLVSEMSRIAHKRPTPPPLSYKT